GGTASLAAGDTVDPERFGVVLGADRICAPLDESVETYRACMVQRRFDFGRWGTKGIPASFPLGFLRVLPNMITSHVSIALDARGPNNTIHHAEVSGLSAVCEAARVIERGQADVMIAGGASSQMDPFDCVRRCVMGLLSQRHCDPASAMCPFDADRDGQVFGEGAAAFVLESRRHARRRGARVLATLSAWSASCEPRRRGTRLQGTGICRAVELVLERAGIGGDSLGHVNAHGLSTIEGDSLEARALHATVPGAAVTAPKSYFGNLGAAGGAVEMAVSVLAFDGGTVPGTLNYRRGDPDCPIRIIDGKSVCSSQRPALTLNWTSSGQATAVVLGGPG
ncbi:MAG: beta-ketoacyl-[acyl-carrier-protein] synthase family protein, partial [Candidatus Nealsonbacteria bacterium]|nr:beta-ketoacyl-[acyl-carrier-protein] synthase family protein [Candidatus Nealsonbacteria bacterium]